GDGSVLAGTYGNWVYNLDLKDSGISRSKEFSVENAYIMDMCLLSTGEPAAATARNGVFIKDSGGWGRLQESNWEGCSTGKVWAVTEESSGRVVLGTERRGCIILESCTAPDTLTTPLLSDRRVRCLETDTHGRLWIGTECGGVTGLGGGDILYLNKSNGLSGNNIRGLLCDTSLLYAGSWDGGLDSRASGEWKNQGGVSPLL
ncbi:MAG: two-component regulator propeller domain-containing protein, partial [Chitinivibrionales bacterium]